MGYERGGGRPFASGCRVGKYRCIGCWSFLPVFSRPAGAGGVGPHLVPSGSNHHHIGGTLQGFIPCNIPGPDHSKGPGGGEGGRLCQLEFCGTTRRSFWTCPGDFFRRRHGPRHHLGVPRDRPLQWEGWMDIFRLGRRFQFPPGTSFR